MSATWHVISAPVGRALATCTAYDGARVTITERLDPEVWVRLKSTLEKLGAVYAIGASAFEFQPGQDARSLVANALSAGRIMREAHESGYVPTPASLADEVVDSYANVGFGNRGRLRVLEPSAGTGRLVEAIARVLGQDWVDVTAVEPDTRRARQVAGGATLSVVNETFEVYAERARARADRFDLVVMNPPFSVPGRPTIWVDHLLGAWELVTPGGRLIAILPASVLERDRRGRVATACELVRQHGAGRQLDGDAFADAGVTYSTAVVWMDRSPNDRPSPAGRPGAHASLFRAYSGAEVPVAVPRPFLTRRAASTMPVQAWRDPWRGGRSRVFRFCADCVICDLPVWGFDDGEDDPRGILGESSAVWSIVPRSAESLVPTPVGVCATCGNDGKLVDEARALAAELMARAATTVRPELMGQRAGTVPRRSRYPDRHTRNPPGSSGEHLTLGF